MDQHENAVAPTAKEQQITSPDSSMRRLAQSIASWVITLLVPIALIGLAVRLVLVPVFLQVEYRMPYFPPDDYGFTTQQRIQWATYAWNYLVNSAGPGYLGDLKFEDGKPLFNEREVSHMHDVKGVIQGTMMAWYASLALLALLGVWAWRACWLASYRQGLRRGGWLTIGLAALIGSIVVIGIAMDPDVFWNFFAWFHSLFFKGNTWIFAYSDTLIRLFPIRFWQDTFLAAAVIVLAGGLGLGFGLRKSAAR
jgi:integral membrane protein (TIGR01906 family)